MNKLLSERFQSSSLKLKELLRHARKITICLDGWSQKGLSASFLGISACFFDATTNQPRHAILNLEEIDHPHTGVMLAACLERSLNQWNITPEKVLLIVSDNGTNIVKAITLLQLNHAASCQESAIVAQQEGAVEEEEDGDDEGNDTIEVDSEEAINFDLLTLPNDVTYRQMSYMAHTLQLIIKPVYVHFDTLLTKTRHLVGRVRKSSIAIEKLVTLCGKSVITDCTTRWNSTYLMINRLLSIKTNITNILTELGNDLNS
jgi:hypothetical protein